MTMMVRWTTIDFVWFGCDVMLVLVRLFLPIPMLFNDFGVVLVCCFRVIGCDVAGC